MSLAMAESNEGPSNRGPLEGLRVVEMGQLIAGPFCGQLLGDLGADVVKVEAPGDGDPMRQWGQPDFPLFWEILARNKRSVSIDLRKPEGQALARRLIDQADILIENFRPGTLEKWNLSPERLHQDNPGLIISRVSGYGQTGPYAARAGFGGIGEAMGGWRHIVGEPDRPPSRMGVSIGDSLAAMFACLGALAALRHRERTGEGQVVDSSLYESVLHVMESLVPDHALAGYTRERSGSILPGIAPSNVYRCLDGEYLIGANQNTVFQRLCAAMNMPALAADPRYETHEARGKNQRELDDLIGAWTATRTIAEVEASMIEGGVPAGRIYVAADMLVDPHFKAREALVQLAHPRWGRIPMQNAYPKLSRTPGSVRFAAPQIVGEHTGEILAELGIGPEELNALKQGGVV
jgi:crotonobetainyl-CoA:carnitine CoA-transferase CaiB-like acyl-CoA transferase